VSYLFVSAQGTTSGDVVPLWFSDAPTGIFDESRRVGGLTIDVALPVVQEVERIVDVLLRKLADVRQPVSSSQLSLPTPHFNG
jgi:hypothetical protein